MMIIRKILKIEIDENCFQGILSVPERDQGALVIFVHGSGSSGYSPRNKYLSGILNESGISTLLVDLLTIREITIDNQTKEYRFDIELQTKRLLNITDAVVQGSSSLSDRLGYFGSSTGTAVAISAAIQRPSKVITIVSRSGRPDLVKKQNLKQLSASLLLLVGANDNMIIQISRKTIELLNDKDSKKIVIVPGATHLFEESGKIEQIGRIAAGWFKEQLAG